MPTDRKPNAAPIGIPIAGASDACPPACRSRITNGKRWLDGVDMRSSRARRWKDIVRSLTADLGGRLTTSETALVRQAATLLVRSEGIQAAVVRGDPIDDEEHVRLSNAAQRVLESLGLSRKLEEAENRRALAEFQARRRRT